MCFEAMHRLSETVWYMKQSILRIFNEILHFVNLKRTVINACAQHVHVLQIDVKILLQLEGYQCTPFYSWRTTAQYVLYFGNMLQLRTS